MPRSGGEHARRGFAAGDGLYQMFLEPIGYCTGTGNHFDVGECRSTALLMLATACGLLSSMPMDDFGTPSAMGHDAVRRR